MKNNQIGSIAVNEAGLQRKKFNLSHDVNTTLNVGEVQPLSYFYMTPNSKITIKRDELVRLAAMVRPAFTRQSLQAWSMFVPMSEVMPNLPYMLSGKSIARVGSSGPTEFIPQQVPTISTRQLTLMCLIGATCTIWRSPDKDLSGAEVVSMCHYWNNPEASTNVAESIFDWISTTGNVKRFYENEDLTSTFQSKGPAINLNQFYAGAHPELKVPFAWTPNAVVGLEVGDSRSNYVPLDSADLVYVDVATDGDANVNGYTFAYAFRLSNFGKRIRKILVGLGYELDLASNESVSILPILAWYRGYYELFGVQLYSNFTQSACFKLIQYFTNNNVTNFLFDVNTWNSMWNDTSSVWWQFVRDLGECFYSESTDYVNAHTETASIGSASWAGQGDNGGTTDALRIFGNNFVDVSAVGIDQFVSSFDPRNPATLAMNSVNHGALDEEFLKICYRWTNRYTILGEKTQELLKALGLGSYEDEVKVQFVGHDKVSLSVSDVTATSDTFGIGADNVGSHLGDYAGKSVNYKTSDTITWETKEFGFLFTYVTIVVDAGYWQGLDPLHAKAIRRFGFYTPEFDGKGFEATSKNKIVGNSRITGSGGFSGNGSVLTFGYVPQMTAWKVKSNRMNGDFSLPSARAALMPFTQDKFIPINERLIRAQNSGNNHVDKVSFLQQLTFTNLPNAGLLWRYLGKFAWQGYFNRIFVNSGTEFDSNGITEFGESFVENGNKYVLYTETWDDNYLMHNILEVNYYAKMLPIGMSYQASDDEAPANSAVKKA